MKTVFLSISRYLALLTGVLLALLVASLGSTPATAQEKGVIRVDSSPEIAPVLSFIRNNTQLEVNADDNNLLSGSWQRAGPLVSEPDCRNDPLDYGSKSAARRYLTLTEEDNDQWYCFKVGDEDGNAGYAKYQVFGVDVEENSQPNAPQAVTAPRVLVERVDNSIRASSSEELLDADWRALMVEGSADCNTDAFVRAPEWRVASSHRINGLTWRDNGSWYCFRVSDSGLSPGYGAIKVDGLPAPADANPPVSETTTDKVAAPATNASAATNTQEDAAQAAAPEGADTEEDEDQASTQSSADEDEQQDDDQDDGDNNNLRLVGVAIVAAGVMALIGILVFSKKPPGNDGNMPEDETENEEF